MYYVQEDFSVAGVEVLLPLWYYCSRSGFLCIRRAVRVAEGARLEIV